MNKEIKKYILLIDKHCTPVDCCIYRFIKETKTELDIECMEYIKEFFGVGYISTWYCDITYKNGDLHKCYEVHESDDLDELKQIAMLEIL